MRIIASKALAAGLLMAFFVTGAYGIEVSVSQGNGPSSSDMVMSFSPGVSDPVEQHIKLDPSIGESENHLYFYGSGSTYRQAYGYNGGYAKSGFSITGSSSTFTSYEFTSSTSPYASVTESLSSSKAKEIYVYGYASSSRGDVAQTYMDVYSPSYNAYLNNYWNNAYGTSYYAQVQQKSGTAGASSSSGKITTLAYASNYYDVSQVYAKQYYYPSLTYYPYSWTATAYGSNYYDKTDAYQGFYGYGYPTYINEYAKNYGKAATTLGQNYYGTHALGQYAYTRSTSQGIQYPHWV